VKQNIVKTSFTAEMSGFRLTGAPPLVFPIGEPKVFAAHLRASESIKPERVQKDAPRIPSWGALFKPAYEMRAETGGTLGK
jgi:hypothetical protein